MSPSSEQTKGGEPAPVVPADGAITTEIHRAVTACATAATIRCALQPKNNSWSWMVGWATKRHHSIRGGWTKKCSYNKGRKGVTGGGTPDTGHGWSHDQWPAGYCDILAQGFNRTDKILIPPRYTFFFRSPTAKNSGVKRAWPGAILGWVTDLKVFSGAYKWGQKCT
jgi:hypothetical protein